MPPAPKLQPALLGGVFIGVLSALPIINIGNCLCCMWVVAGGALAAYLMQQNYPYAITTADGALVGLLAGLIGGIIGVALAVPIELMMGPVQQRMIERYVMSNPDIPPETRDMLGRMATRGAMGVFIVFRAIISAVIGMIFGMLGGLLGVALFKKKDVLPPPGTTEILPPA
jgi:hypothetical protein